MNEELQPLTILMADDDPEDCLMVRNAFERGDYDVKIITVTDGRALIDYLSDMVERGAGDRKAVKPDLILLDLNMPRMDGREALQAVRANPDLRGLPVIIYTTSHNDEDVVLSYRLGANSYIRKPSTLAGLMEMVKSVHGYWGKTVTLPRGEPGGAACLNIH